MAEVTAPIPLRAYAVHIVVSGNACTAMDYHHEAVVDAVEYALRYVTDSAGVPVTRDNVVWVRQQPICNWCTRPATAYDRNSGDGTPLCMEHVYNEYPDTESRKQGAGLMGVSRYVPVPEDEWKGERS